jgi:hypothetical protein
MAVGLERPPRWARYDSSQLASARHSTAQRFQRLERVSQIMQYVKGVGTLTTYVPNP